MKEKVPVRTSTPEFLTPPEVAKLLNVSLDWVYSQRRKRVKNPLPAIVLGHALRYRRADIEAWLNQRRQAA